MGCACNEITVHGKQLPGNSNAGKASRYIDTRPRERSLLCSSTGMYDLSKHAKATPSLANQIFVIQLLLLKKLRGQANTAGEGASCTSSAPLDEQCCTRGRYQV